MSDARDVTPTRGAAAAEAAAAGAAAAGAAAAGAAAAGFALERRWQLHPQVSIRPEAFGALLYHFGTRQLSFLKDRRLAAAVQALPTSTSAAAACRSAGWDEIPPHVEASLAALARTGMIVPAQAAQPVQPAQPSQAAQPSPPSGAAGAGSEEGSP